MPTITQSTKLNHQHVQETTNLTSSNLLSYRGISHNPDAISQVEANCPKMSLWERITEPLSNLWSLVKDFFKSFSRTRDSEIQRSLELTEPLDVESALDQEIE